eukprot:scaffold1522_cov101-Isochrysis_galbana.AAC.6
MHRLWGWEACSPAVEHSIKAYTHRPVFSRERHSVPVADAERTLTGRVCVLWQSRAHAHQDPDRLVRWVGQR